MDQDLARAKEQHPDCLNHSERSATVHNKNLASPNLARPATFTQPDQAGSTLTPNILNQNQ